MDPEQTFLRVHARLSGMLSQLLTPRIRLALEYIYLGFAVALFCLLVVMHTNFVQQPGCSSELSGIESSEGQLVQIKIVSGGLWSHYSFGRGMEYFQGLGSPIARFSDVESAADINSLRTRKNDADISAEAGLHIGFPLTTKESFKAAIAHLRCKWHTRFTSLWRNLKHVLENAGQLWNIAGWNLFLDISKRWQMLRAEHFSSLIVQWLATRASEPTYLYTQEKGYFLLSEGAKFQHNVRTVNITISAQSLCFGNRWQQLLINSFVGYDTILMNSLLSFPGHGYLYNYQTREFYDLSYVREPLKGPAKFIDYFVTKCGVLIMSLFVFFTTTMSVSFTLRETQSRMLKFTGFSLLLIMSLFVFFTTTMSVSFTLRETQSRMLKFTVQLQHHARHQLPTFQLIFVHVIESLVFVPIMIGILFFLFEFYDDQLLAILVLTLVWLCELFTMISVRTSISMQFFPRFFLLYFLVFHVYFFSYAYGFSYLAFSAAATFMQHLILYFWNRFEVPALQRYMRSRVQLQQHAGVQITSSAIYTSTLGIERVNVRNPSANNVGESELHRRPGPVNPDILEPGDDQGIQQQSTGGLGTAGGTNPQLTETSNGSSFLNPFGSYLLWLLGGSSTDVMVPFFSMFRDARPQGQTHQDSTSQGNETTT